MSKLVKYVLLTLASLLLLVVVVLAGMVLFVDPNDYKDNITALVHDATGRELTLAGDIQLSVFPWLGLSLGEAQLSNAKGFGEVPFASVKNVDIKIKLVPLFSQRIEMKALRLHGLRVQLAKNAKGVSNWDDLTAAKQAETAPQEAAKAPPGNDTMGLPIAALAIGGLEVLDARIEWDDRQAKQHLVLDQLDLTTGPVDLIKPIAVELAMDVSLAEPAWQSHVDFAGRVGLDLEAQRYRIDDLNLELQARAEVLPVSPLTTRLSANVIADLAREQLDVDALKLSVLGLVVEAQASVSKFQSAPQAQGKLSIARFSPRELMSVLALAVPETADASVLTRASVAAEFTGSAAAVKLNKLELILDDTRITGTAGLANVQQKAMEFDLALTEIDVDRYLPPGSAAPPLTPSAAAAGVTQLPLEPIRQLNVVGQIKAGKLKISNLHLSDILLGFKARGGQLRLHPAKASLYQGSYSGNIGLDVRTDTPRVSLQEKLKGISIGPLLKDVLGDDTLSGTGDVTAVLTARGVDPEVIKKSLNGKASISLRDGAVKGVNLGQMIREANARLKNLPAPAKTANQTDFAQLSASASIKNGVVSNNDLLLKSPLLRITGKGTVDLPREQLNYLVNTSIVETAEGRAGKELGDLKSLTIPVKVSGSFANPKFSLDLEPLLKAKVKQKVEKEIEQKKEDAVKKLQQKLKDKFKNLF